MTSDELLEQLRNKLDYEWNCDDIRSNWEGDFIDALLYGAEPLGAVLKEFTKGLQEEKERDMFFTNYD